MKKKGYAIVLDAVFALAFALIILVGFAGYSKYSSDEMAFKRMHYLSEDIFDTLNKQGVLDDVGEEWAAANGTTNSTSWLSAENMSSTYLEELIPENMGYRLLIENDVLAESNASRPPESEALSKTNAERLLVGYGKGLPTRGYVSRAFLTNIAEKTNSIYSYFGGFVGQGDVTQYIRGIPEDAFIHQACLELNAGDQFDLYVNDNYAGTFSPSGDGMSANIKGAAGCIANPRTYFTSGDNKFQLKFTGSDINNKYIGGGFLKVIYNTTQPETEQEVKVQYDWMPKIEGLINYYSSIYVPGDVNAMDMYLHFRNNHTTFMTAGDSIIFDTGNAGNMTFCQVNGDEYNCTLPDSYLATMLSYGGISEKTMPIRIGVGNISSVSNIDVMLVNDKSGSMRQSGWILNATGDAAQTFENVSAPRDGWSSTNSFIINTSVKQLAAAITWDRKEGYVGSEGSEFVVNLRRPDGTWVFSEYSGKPDSAGNKVDPPDAVGQSGEYYSGICTKPQALFVENPQAGTWRVAVYGWNLRPKDDPPSSMNVNISIYVDTNLTTDDDLNKTNTTFSYLASQEAARTFVGQLTPEDHAGYVKFESSSTMPQGLTENKTRVEIAINNTGVGGGTSIHLGIDDANYELVNHGRENVQHIMILMTDGQNDDGPDPVIQSANYAKNNGTKIFTIGLTAFVNEEMLQSVASEPDYYYYAPTAADLESIYNEISRVINDTYRSQILNVTGEINYTILYDDSYINTQFTPEEISSYGELSFVLSTPPFDNTETCTGYLYVPEGVTIVEAKVTSYSSEHWTDLLTVENDEYNEPYKLWRDYGDLGYTMLGDPYTVYIPTQYLPSDVNNSLHIETGDSQSTRTGCSADDRVIYTVRMKMMVEYGDVFQHAEGCTWTIEFEDGSILTTEIPADYNETELCYYTSNNITVNTVDSMDNSIYRLMSHLDLDKNGKVDVMFDPEKVNFEVSRAGGVKSLWGPTKFTLVLWM